MKHQRNPLQKITIKQSTPALSRKNYSVHSSLSKNQSVLKQSNDSQNDQNPQLKSIKQVADMHVPAKGQQQISQNEPKDESQNLEQSKIHELKNNLSSLSVSVSDIKHEYNDLNDSITKILASSKNKPNKRKITKLDHPQIASFLFKKQQEQQQRQKRRLDEIARLQKIKGQRQANQQKLKQQEKQQKINSLKKQWFVKQKNQSVKQQQSQKQKQAEQIFKKYRDSIPLFQIKEKLSKQQQAKKTQLMKEYLKRHKENYLAVNQSFREKELQQHKKKDQEKVAQLDKQKNQAKIPIFQKIQKDNESFKNLYRGKVTDRVIQEIKLQEEKRQIPYRIRERIKGYESHVKENYKPKLRQSKLRSNSSSLQIKSKRNNESNLSVRQIKRYKYIQGVSYGEIIQQRHMAKSYEEKRRAGNGYLEYMKSLPKKRIPQVESAILPIPKSSRPNPLMHNRKPKAFVDITDEPTRDEINMVLQQLRQNDKKIKEKEKIAYIKGQKHELMDSDRKEINDQILLNVEKKIDLLHKLQNNKVKMENEDDNEDNEEDY